MEIVVTPNAFSFLALVLAVPVMAALFAWLRPSLALMASALWGVLFLPERVVLFDVAALPPVDKAVVISLSLLVACCASSSGRRLLVVGD